MSRRLQPPVAFGLQAACLAALALLAAGAEPAAPPVFEKDVLPLFQSKGLSCHGPDKRKAELDVRGKATLLKGGENGPCGVRK